MSEKVFPLEMIKESEAFTVEEWRELTHDWTPLTMQLAVIARRYPYAERQERGNNVFSSVELQGAIPEQIELITTIWSLSDEALDRMVSSFSEEKRKLLQEDP